MSRKSIYSIRAVESVLQVLATSEKWLTAEQTRARVNEIRGRTSHRVVQKALADLKGVGLLRYSQKRSNGRYGQEPIYYRARPMVLALAAPESAGES